MVKKIYEKDIEEELCVCPYCGEDWNDRLMCCGENHWSNAYLVDGEILLEDEVEIIEPDREGIKGDMQLRALKDGDL